MNEHEESKHEIYIRLVRQQYSNKYDGYNIIFKHWWMQNVKFLETEGHNENKCIKFVMQQYRDKFDGYNINFKQCECEMCEKWFAVLKNLEEH